MLLLSGSIKDIGTHWGNIRVIFGLSGDNGKESGTTIVYWGSLITLHLILNKVELGVNRFN